MDQEDRKGKGNREIVQENFENLWVTYNNMREKKLSFGFRFYISITFDTLATAAGKVLMVFGRSCWRRQYVAPIVGEGGGGGPIVGLSWPRWFFFFFFFFFILICLLLFILGNK